MPFPSFRDAQSSLGNLQDEMNNLLAKVWHGGFSAGPFDGQEWAPSLDLYESEDCYKLFIEVSGVGADRVDVSHVGSTLTIRGEKEKSEELSCDMQSLRVERRFGKFCRTIELPGDVDLNNVSAKCQDGVLEICVPKLESSKPKAVKIDITEE